jgi:multidrug resistance protein, MATE family
MQEVKAQYLMGAPLALNLFFLYTIQVVTLAFLGHEGTEQLAAAALSMTAVNTLGSLFFMGLCGATDTLAAQVGFLLLRFACSDECPFHLAKWKTLSLCTF